MQSGLNILIYLALGAVIVILGAGLWNMTRGGSPNLSQRLMRARVIAQFIAIILLVVAVAVFGSRG